ncbi:MAG: hypothetical protein JSR78_11845 [Proteobacteria bacterium]|nr:hypothetical protein [Pseudomonadota bacterium]
MGDVMATNDRSHSAWTTDSEHPEARFAADYALQLDICASLLAVADSLPGSLNTTTIDILSKLVQSTWEAHLKLLGEVILPLVARRHESISDVQKLFTPLTRQHIEISSLNDELTECFEMIARGEPVESGMLGFLIRNAADRRREHVDWEKALLSPLLPKILSPTERQVYAEWAAANPWPYEGFNVPNISDLN